MKKRTIIYMLCLAVLAAVTLAACGGADPGPSQPPAVPDGTAAEGSPPPAGDETVFTPGTWLSDGGRYYFFDEGAATGRTASLDDGTGVGFSYVLNGTEAVFTMGAADSAAACTVSRRGEDVVLEWADGAAERLTYVSGEGSDTFQFYSNQELEELALAYYKETSGAEDTGNLTAAAQTNDDGTVTIQVYENLGDHNSTAAWYTVDRRTAFAPEKSSPAK